MAKSTRFSPGSQFIRALILAASLIGLSTLAQAQLSNGSFELPKLADGQTADPLPTGYGWFANGGVQLVRDAAYLGTTPYRVDPPMGRQWVMLKPGTSISQMVTLTAGYYFVGLSALQAQGNNPALTLAVSLNGYNSTQTPADLNGTALGTSPAPFTHGYFYVPGGTYTLTITANQPPPNIYNNYQAYGIWLDNVVLYKQGTNAPPSVAVVYPNAGQVIIPSYYYPNTELRATAIDADGTISSVKFYDGTTLLGTVTAPPWTLPMSVNSIATRTITAKAFDGITETTSDPVVFSHHTGGAPPYIEGGNFETPAAPSGGLTSTGDRWSFYPGGGVVASGYTNYYGNLFSRPGEGRQSAFIGTSGYPNTNQLQYYYVTLPASGNYGMSFIASVAGGNLIVSNYFTGNSMLVGAGTNGRVTMPFTVSSPYPYFSPVFASQTGWGMLTIDDVRVGPAGPPTVSITVPNNAQTFTAPTAITFVAATDSYDRNVTEVEFFQGATSIGKATTYPFSITWVHVAPGTYSITAKVKDSLSAGVVSVTSAPISITVDPPATPAFFNAGFEYRSGFGYWAYIHSIAPNQGWRGGGNYGTNWVAALGAASSGFNSLDPLVPPERITAAGVHASSWIEQDVYFPPGNYQVRFKAQTYAAIGAQVRVNGIVAGTPVTPTSSFADVTSGTFTVSTAGFQTIRVDSSTPAAGGYLVVDDFRIIVVPNAPTVTADFNPTSIAFNGTSTLSASIQNGNAVPLTSGQFSINYPAGLTNSATPAATTTGSGCTGLITASAAGGTMALSGATIPAQTTCVYSVQTQGTGSGAKTISTGAVTTANAANSTAGNAILSVAPQATVPSAPAAVAATASNAQATVTFTAAINGGSAITSYTVTSNPNNKTGIGPTSPITVTGLTNGTAYTFTVIATNAIGPSASSPPSNSVTPVAVPGAPTIGTVVGGDTQVTVYFVPPVSDGGNAISSYTATCGLQTASGSAAPITVIGLANAVTVTCTVVAINSLGTGAASAPSYSVMPSVPISAYLTTSPLCTSDFTTGFPAGGQVASFTPDDHALTLSVCAITSAQNICGSTFNLQVESTPESGAFVIVSNTAGDLTPDLHTPSAIRAVSFPATVADMGSTTAALAGAASTTSVRLGTVTLAPLATATNLTYRLRITPNSILSIPNPDCANAISLPIALGSSTQPITLNKN